MRGRRALTDWVRSAKWRERNSNLVRVYTVQSILGMLSNPVNNSMSGFPHPHFTDKEVRAQGVQRSGSEVNSQVHLAIL